MPVPKRKSRLLPKPKARRPQKKQATPVFLDTLGPDAAAVTLVRDEGSAQLMRLVVKRPDTHVTVFLDLETAAALHGALGTHLVDATAELNALAAEDDEAAATRAR